MRAMLRRLLSLIALAALGVTVGACGAGDPPPLDAVCTSSPDVIEHALDRAPAPVTLGDGHAPVGVRLARAQRRGAPDRRRGPDPCGRRPRRRAQHGDPQAAVGLGYLVGAARRGAKRTAGIHAELQRRVESSARVLADGGPDVARALQRGVRAGEATG